MMKEHAYSKDISTSFILSKTKLYKMSEVINSRFESIAKDDDFRASFEVSLEKGKKHSTENIESILELDNSAKDPIKELTVRWTYYQKETNLMLHYTSDVVYGRSIRMSGKSSSHSWLTETIGEVEEQVERCIPVGFVYRLKKYLTEFSWIIWGGIPVFAGTVLAVVAAFYSGGTITYEVRNKLTELSKHVKTSDEKIDFIYKVLNEYLKSSHDVVLNFDFLLNVKFYLMIAPVVIISLTFEYLYLKCYPLYVFDWGDCGENYQKLIEKRKLLWTVIIGSMIIGVIANLFVLGLSTFSGGSIH